MAGFIDWLFVALIILGFGYALVWQVRNALAIKRNVKLETQADKRQLTGYYMKAASFAGFYVSYLLNVLLFVRPETAQHALINSNTTNFACYIFLALILVSKFWIVPKKDENLPLLKAKFQ